MKFQSQVSEALQLPDADRRAHFSQTVLNGREKLKAPDQKIAIPFQNQEEVAYLAQAMCELYPNSDNAMLGLLELLLNAVEHGNLGLGFEKKIELTRNGTLDDELEKRLQQDEYRNRYATLTLVRQPDRIVATIRDDGDGFNWQPYLLIDDRRLSMPTGRGIALANMVCFDTLSYNDCGNEVTATVFC